jgi:hypothetical protein
MKKKQHCHDLYIFSTAIIVIMVQKTQLLNKHVDTLGGASQSMKKKQQYHDLHILYSNNGTKTHNQNR